MSQYPSPYQPQQPTGYYSPGTPYTDPRGPAKRASIMMFAVGGLLSLCGLCCMGMGPLMGKIELDPQQMAEFNQFEAETGMTMQALFIGLGVASILPGLILLILGFFVRNGGIGAAVTGIVFVSICILGTLVMLAGTFVNLAEGGPGNPLAGIALVLFILAMLGLLLFWLIQAARNASQVAATQTQYQMQYWQYQQQQQAYQQPPPPPPQPQQQQPNPPQQNWPPPPPPPETR